MRRTLLIILTLVGCFVLLGWGEAQVGPAADGGNKGGPAALQAVPKAATETAAPFAAPVQTAPKSAVSPASAPVEPPAGHPGTAKDKPRVSVLGNVVVEAGETVNSDAVATVGNVLISGTVSGNAVATVGSVEVKPGGRVVGDAVATVGNVILRKGATVEGNAVATGGKVIKETGAVVNGQTVSTGPRLPGGERKTRGQQFLESVLFAILAVVLTAILPRRVQTIAEASLSRIGRSALYGLVAGLLILPLALLLIITLIGIPLVLVEGLITFAAVIMGRVGVSVAVGRRTAQAFGRGIASPALSALVGSIVLALVGLVPGAGPLLVFVLGLLGFGAAVLTGLGSSPEWLPDRFTRRR